ncbi:polysaccharide deacetylase family protein [Abditibacterium utsteinense]|nr:polysaccharide deacetylase family protein [Abditibacterium utsteinense]
MKHEEILSNSSSEVALTIDDAPHPLTTPLLLASMKRADVKATFFCVGEGLRLYPELAHRIVSEGHHLGNHSQPHHNLTTINPALYPLHVDACFSEIENVGKDAGIPMQTRLFRPPGGGLNRALMDYLYRRGDTLAWWSNNIGDWTCPPAWKIADGVKANLKAGDILLLHDGGTGTPQAIPSIVKEARKRGFNFVLMPE